MKKLLLSMATVPLVIGGLSVSASAADGVNILNNVQLKGEIRPRYEYANDGRNTADSANAFTARTHLVVSAGLLDIDNLSATIGLQSVNNFGSNTYYSKANGQTQYDVIADPQQAMLSEASLDYKIDKTALHVGRSQVNLDNQRFIGTVGWRQNERSYDTVYAANNSIENLSVLAAWVYGFQGVVGPAAATTQDNTVMPELKVTAYDYMVASTSDTIGVALTGKLNLGAKLSYRAEYAVQSDATMEIHNVAKKADADYINLDLGANINGILAGVNYEILSGTSGTDGKTNFNPALGTNHKFNGWADVFFVGNSGPKGGLQDANIRLGYKAKSFGKVLAVYHDFTADVKIGGQDDLGSEIDFLYVNKIPGVNNLKGLVKYASYSAGNVTGYTADKQVAWLMLDYKFATK